MFSLIVNREGCVFACIMLIILAGCESVKITSEPAGAFVFRDGKPIGQTPVKTTMLRLGGSADFVFSKEGYQRHRYFLESRNVLIYDDYPDVHVKLEPDPFAFETAMSGENGPALPQSARVPSQIKKGQGFAVIVGISRYIHAGQDGLSNLAYADQDALLVRDNLRKMGWAEDRIQLLVNEQATKRNVEKVMADWLTRAENAEMLVFFWAGHGYPNPDDPEKVYLVCHDTEVRWPSTGLRMGYIYELLKEKNAKNTIVLADTCHAGKLATRAVGVNKAAVQTYVETLAEKKRIPEGWIYLCAADSDRTAVEVPSWANGAFTLCLDEALSGKADGYQRSGAADGRITLGEIKTYLLNRMPALTQEAIGVAKHPFYSTSSGSPAIWDLTLEYPR